MNQDTKVFSVKMKSTQDGPEPEMSWNREQKSYNTASSRQQLGAVSVEVPSPQDHGLLALNHRIEWREVNATQLLDPSDLSNPDILYDTYSSHMFYLMSYEIDAVGDTGSLTNRFVFVSNMSTSEEISVYGTHAALFQQTLHETGSPALTLQALFTRVSQMIYYDSLRRAPPLGLAYAVFSSAALIPVRWYGLFGSAMIIGTHLFATLAAAAVFLLCSDKSELGNMWQALSQVVTDDTLPVLKRASGLRDKDVLKVVRLQFPDLVGDGRLARRKDGDIS